MTEPSQLPSSMPSWIGSRWNIFGASKRFDIATDLGGARNSDRKPPGGLRRPQRCRPPVDRCDVSVDRTETPEPGRCRPGPETPRVRRPDPSAHLALSIRASLGPDSLDCGPQSSVHVTPARERRLQPDGVMARPGWERGSWPGCAPGPGHHEEVRHAGGAVRAGHSVAPDPPRQLLTYAPATSPKPSNGQ